MKERIVWILLAILWAPIAAMGGICWLVLCYLLIDLLRTVFFAG